MSNKMALDALTAALDAMEHMANTLNNMDAVDEDEDAQHDAAFEAVRAAIAALQAEPQPKEGATDGLTPEQVRKVCAEAERLAAQAAPTEPPQEFESAQGRALASAWAEGWAQCRDAEYVGEEAESEAFNQSATLAQCLHADQTRFQGGLSNDELRRAWSAKLPNVIPTDEQLTAFALGIEAAAQPSQAPVVQAVRHVCGLQGFGAIGDVCPACAADRAHIEASRTIPASGVIGDQ